MVNIGKLVEMAAALDIFVSNDREQRVAVTPEKLAALRAAIIADLAKDVEPLRVLHGPRTHVCWTPDSTPPDQRELVYVVGEADVVRTRATVAALQARVAELEKDGPVVRIGTRGNGTAVMTPMREALGLMELAATTEAQYANELKAELNALLGKPLSDDEIAAAWADAKKRLGHDPYTPREAFWAGVRLSEQSKAENPPENRTPFLHATVEKGSGLHELWLARLDAQGLVEFVAGPEPWPAGWPALYDQLKDEDHDYS